MKVGFGYQVVRYPQNIKVGNGEYVQANYKGTVMLLVKAGNKTRKIKLLDVLFVPNLKYNLFSVSKAAARGNKVEFTRSECRIVDTFSREVIVSASKVGNLYHLDCSDRDQNQRQPVKATPRKDMEKALLSVRENNFKEEMMRRLSSIERENIDLEERLDKFEGNNNSVSYKFEENNNSISYSFKEDVSQNQTACDNGGLINFLKNNRGDKFCFESEIEDSSDEESGIEYNSEDQTVISKEEENEIELEFAEVFEESTENCFQIGPQESDAQGEDKNMETQMRQMRRNIA